MCEENFDNLVLCDFDKKGNLIRLYFTNDPDYYGDDWDDCPYEHNAGRVYSEFIEAHLDFAVPFEMSVFEPADDWTYGGNSPYCKYDMKNEKCPCLVFSQSEYDNYSTLVGDKNAVRIYFNTKYAEVKSELLANNCIEVSR